MRNFIVTIDGKSYQVAVEEVGSSSDGKNPVPISEPIKAAAPEPYNKGGQKVLSPFPGLIKKLLVAEGAIVKKEQPVIVLEAMKMDNEITAPCDGKISFKVANDANVETNSLLAVIS